MRVRKLIAFLPTISEEEKDRLKKYYLDLGCLVEAREEGLDIFVLVEEDSHEMAFEGVIL